MPTGLLAGFAYCDLVPIRNNPALLREIVVTAVKPGRHRDVSSLALRYWRAPRPIVHHDIKATPNFTGQGAELEAVADALGCLPLALSHAAALLRARPNITLAAYLANIDRRMKTAPKDAEYSRAVFATFQEALDEAEREAEGASLAMALCAFFAPDHIPELLFHQPVDCYPPALVDLMAAGGLDDAVGVTNFVKTAGNVRI